MAVSEDFSVTISTDGDWATAVKCAGHKSLVATVNRLWKKA